MKDGRPTVCFPWKSETPQQLFALTRMVQRSSEAPVVFPVLELASWICGEIPTLEGGPPSPAHVTWRPSSTGYLQPSKFC